MPFTGWAERWIAARFTRPTTQAGNRSALRRHLLPAFGERALKDITPPAVRAFVAEMSTIGSPKTVRNLHAILSTIMRDAVLEGLLLNNPRAGIRLPKGRPYEAVFLNTVQIDRLVQATPAFHRPLILTAAGTGMRWGRADRAAGQPPGPAAAPAARHPDPGRPRRAADLR